MPKRTASSYVYSKPTMCLDCHIVVEMVHDIGVDPVKGAWRCPRCNHSYPFAHWRIRKQTPKTSKAA